RPGRRATDRNRSALVIDYRGDAPPTGLFESLRSAGWLVPVVLSPPSGSIDWTSPDLISGKNWTIRPYTVTGAVAVPGPGLGDDRSSVVWLREFLAGQEIALDGEPEGVLSLTSPSPGFGEVIESEDLSEGGSRDRLTVKPFPGSAIPVERYPHLNEAPLATEVQAPGAGQKHRSLGFGANLARMESPPVVAVVSPAATRPANREPGHSIDGPLVWDRSLAAS
ncbi:MAG: hypothetical protein ABIP03_07815, partial [Aquihabitans sp.]